MWPGWPGRGICCGCVEGRQVGEGRSHWFVDLLKEGHIKFLVYWRQVTLICWGLNRWCVEWRSYCCTDILYVEQWIVDMLNAGRISGFFINHIRIEKNILMWPLNAHNMNQDLWTSCLELCNRPTISLSIIWMHFCYISRASVRLCLVTGFL